MRSCYFGHWSNGKLTTANVSFPPIADISRICDARLMTLSAPFALAARASSLLGCILWALVLVYCLIVVASGFVDWAAPNAYVATSLIISGLVVNLLLLRRAETVVSFFTVALMVVSLILSTLIVGIFCFMAVGR